MTTKYRRATNSMSITHGRVRRPWWLGVLASIGLLATLAPVMGRAETLDGTVKVAGTGFDIDVMLTAPKEPGGPTICKGDFASRVRQLAGMVVQVNGAWETKPNGDKTCFRGSQFTVVKTSAGGDAVVATVKVEEGGIKVTPEGGKTIVVHDPPNGLKKLDGKKAILELSTLPAQEGATAALTKVVSYAPFP